MSGLPATFLRALLQKRRLDTITGLRQRATGRGRGPVHDRRRAVLRSQPPVTCARLAADAPPCEGVPQQALRKLRPIRRAGQSEEEACAGTHRQKRYRFRAVVIVRPASARRVVIILLVNCEYVSSEGLVVASLRHVKGVVERDEARRRARFQVSLPHDFVILGIGRTEERPVDRTGSTLDTPATPCRSLEVGSRALVTFLFPRLAIRIIRSVDRIDVVSEEPLERRARDHRNTPGVMNREAHVGCARVAMSDEQPARERKLEDAITWREKAVLPALESLGIVGRHGHGRDVREPLCSLVVGYLAVVADGRPRVISKSHVLRRSNRSKNVAHVSPPRASLAPRA